MSNIAISADDATARFIAEFSSMQVPWGMPLATGRLYGFLMLSPDPVTLDEIAAALAIAKSSASVMTRSLENAGVVRRYGETGSKRVRYAAAEDPAGLFAAKTVLLNSVVRMLETQVSAPIPEHVKHRLKRHAYFYAGLREAIDRMLIEPDEDGGM